MKFSPYLMFNGDCEQAFQFYQQCLGGKLELLRYSDGPEEMCAQLPAEWRDKVMHACLTVGDEMLMASDAPPGEQEPIKGFSVTIGIDDPDEAERAFNALAEGGNVRMSMQQTFWSLRFGMLVDRFGVPWMVNCTRQPQTGTGESVAAAG